MSEYKLTFSNSAFNAGDISGITKTWKNYTHTIKNANETVRSLDRYDDFATMKLNVGQYRAESPDSKYGIPFDRNIHSDSGSVITEHQYDAAHAFLQKLRGFGLLADVVGSGKTFEACTVLSELAARGAISTMLLIVPRQVLNEWIHILENRFGLGEGALFKYPDLSKNDKENEVALKELDSLLVTRDGILCPTRPVIVAMEDFLKWNDDMTKCLFDVVVVDEAHHLCDRNKDEYSGAMYKLSLLMETKRKHNKPYCLLLSATPHSGDLEKMFRLWYFIRCKGGDPKDFKGDDVNTDDSTGKHTAKYEKELACYRNEICRGAKTVFDFINKTKISEMLAENSPYRQDLINFYNAKKIEAREAATQDFSQLTEMQKVDLINDYLEEKHEVRDAVLKNVANSYHNGVMRSIMIRSAKSASSRLNGRTKCARNILFFPSSVLDGLIEVEVRGNEKISVDMEKLGDINGEFVIHDGNRISLNEYVTEMGGNLTYMEELQDLSALTNRNFSLFD